MKRYIFTLKPGQQSPNGSLGICLSSGGIVWEGEKWESKDIDARELTAEEQYEYEMLGKYNQLQTRFEITFQDYLDKKKLGKKIRDIRKALDAISSEA